MRFFKKSCIKYLNLKNKTFILSFKKYFMLKRNNKIILPKNFNFLERNPCKKILLSFEVHFLHLKA